VRKAFGARSAGHVGTLDPMATGMLPICLDEATKVIAEIESGAKAYEFTLRLGARTDTGDSEGEVVEKLPVPVLAAATIETALGGFRGVGQQVPPMYSALKRDGRPLYELARKGIEVERQPRSIEIFRLELVEQGVDFLRLVCECAKGTYIRVLGEDLARALGTTGHLSALRRTWVQPFQGMPMQSLEITLASAREGQGLMPPDKALGSLPESWLTEEQCRVLRHGQPVRSAVTPAAEEGRKVRLYAPGGVFLGLAEARPEGWLQPRRLILTDIT
jgi:tRNA pseudouridine55 synthase